MIILYNCQENLKQLILKIVWAGQRPDLNNINSQIDVPLLVIYDFFPECQD